MNSIRFLVVNYLLGPFLGIMVCLLETVRIIDIRHFDRYPLWEGKIIIVSNHPSLLEPVLIPLLGFPWMNFPWIFSPLWSRVKFSLNWFKELQKEFSLQRKLVPVNAPDKKNFYDPPYMGLLQGINIPVDRDGGMRQRSSAASALKQILESGGRILIFPEGTRTFKTKPETRRRTENGKELGELKDGAAWLALTTGAKIVPVWVEGSDRFFPNNELPIPRFWHRVTINIGKTFTLDKINHPGSPKSARKRGSEIIAHALLETGDELG